jgi:crossover junction endodeoxyribonuclease RuvC
VVSDAAGAYRLIDCGVVTTRPDAPLGHRLLHLYERLQDIVERHRPVELAIEKLFFSRNVTSALAVGQARGVAVLAAAQRGLSVVEYTPAEVKHAIANHGGASKFQIQEMVRLLLNLETAPQPDDAADAVAVAICHLNTTQGVGRYSRLAANWP